MTLPRLVADLAAGFSAFGGAARLLEAEWAPEEPPLTVAMSEFGRSLVEEAGDKLSIQDIVEIFQWVERILVDGTETEKDAVATGFLEAVAAAIDRRPEHRWILNHIGLAARKYLMAWDEFCGL